MILRIKDSDGNVQDILVIKGRDGKDYELTEADKREIAEIVYGMGGGGIDTMIDRSITEVTSNVTSVGANAFRDCEKLTSAVFPLATYVDGNAFLNCTALKNISFPLLETVDASAFNGCEALEEAVFPSVAEVYSSAFMNCDALETVDFHSITSIGGFAFRYGYSLRTVVIRSTSMCSLAATTVFSGCYHILGTVNATYNPDGLADGYFYVPSSLVDTYKADSVWSTFANQIRALEDYTVDGTITGALDESKI